jgi:alkylation response protein AidB-like acyl-CoA dehydrogenase
VKVAVGLAGAGLVADADLAQLLLLQRGEALYAVAPDQATLRRNDSVDPSRRLFAVEFEPAQAVTTNTGLLTRSLDYGALGCAAECLGLAQRMVDLSVAYTTDRKQFGKPVGSFQAVKHHMANVAVKLEYARAPVYRAAYSLAHGLPNTSLHVSHAKLAAAEAAALAAKNSIQVHGAMGYTWEVDLHIYMKRAWALAAAFGDTGFHKQRVADALFERDLTPGAANTFYTEHKHA